MWKEVLEMRVTFTANFRIFPGNQIRSFQTGAGNDVVLLGCNDVWTCRQIPMFRRNMFCASSGMKSSTLRDRQHEYTEIHPTNLILMAGLIPLLNLHYLLVLTKNYTV
jgi:hypothetical protein